MNKTILLEASEELFFWKKYQEVKLSTIARKLGIQTPSLYHWFPDKKSLLEATIQHSASRFLTALGETIALWSPEKTILWYLTFAHDHKNLFGVAFQKWFCEDRELRQVFGKYKMMAHQKLSEHFRLYLDNEGQCYLLISLLEKLAAENCIEEYCLPRAPEELAREIENIFFQKA